jgi:hypothetical protein
MPFSPDAAVEAELARLEDMDLVQLRAVWMARIGDVPNHQSADLVRRRLAYELQVRAYGGLRPAVRKRIARLHVAFSSDPSFTPRPGQHLKAGTILTRAWKGIIHQVSILEDCYEYSGQRYASLSEISERITGTKWSGPAFFGLRKQAK